MMNFNLKIFLIIVCVLFMFYIYRKVIKKKIEFRYAIAWMIMVFVLLLLCIFDEVLVPFKTFFGFEVVSNMIFFLGFIFLSLLLLSLSIKMNKQSEKIISLTQEVALLKKEMSNEKSSK